MWSVVLGLVLAVQAEPKLEWATFGDFAEQLNEGSGYRLTMDKSISDRPVVWYFSNPGEDKLALLQRSCKELCLDVAVDEQLKKIFVIGPNKDAGWTLRAKIEATLLKAQAVARENWNLTPEGLDSKIKTLLTDSSLPKDKQEVSLKDFEIELLDSLKRAEERAVLVCLMNTNALSAATRMSTIQRGEGIIPVPREVNHILETKFQNPPDAGQDLTNWQKAKEEYDAAIADGGRFVIRYGVDQSGAVALLLQLDGRTKRQTVGTIFLREPKWLLDSTDPQKDMVPSSLADEPLVEDSLPFWGLDGVNNWQTLAIAQNWNTVGWVNTRPMHRDKVSTIAQWDKADPSDQYPIRMKLSDDGWMMPYVLGQRWPEYEGEWAGVVKMTGAVKPEMARETVSTFLESVTDAELDGIAKIQGAYFPKQVATLVRYGRLIRGALRESADRGERQFDLAVNQLGISGSGDISRFWPFVGNATMRTQGATSRRGSARLRLLEFPDQGIMRVILSVPIGDVAPSGNPLWVTEEAEIVLVKNQLFMRSCK